jgi:hypothetical protein
MIPGRLLLRLASALIPAATRERVIDAQLADFQQEWLLATGAMPRLIALVRGYLAFWCALPLCARHGLRREVRPFLVRLPAALAGLFVLFFLTGAAPVWVRTGSWSWSDLWTHISPGTIAMAPWQVVWFREFRRYPNSSGRLSWFGLLLAMMAALALRWLGLNSHETTVHWLVGQGYLATVALFVFYVARGLARRAT